MERQRESAQIPDPTAWLLKEEADTEQQELSGSKRQFWFRCCYCSGRSFALFFKTGF